MNNEEMNGLLSKAEVLIEALPYIQRFNRKIIVVKYGGSAMADEELQKNVIKDVTLLKLVGFKPIIVHGGGKEISKWVAKVGKEAETPALVMDSAAPSVVRITDAPVQKVKPTALKRPTASRVEKGE